MAGVLVGEHDVELPGDERRQGDLGLALGDLDPQRGVPGVELGECGRDESEDRGLEPGHAQRSDGVVRGPGQRGFSALHLLQQGLGV
jgi:hypothetical protein